MNLFCKAVSPLLVLSSFLILSCDKSDCGLDCDEVVFMGGPTIDPAPTDDVVSAGELFTFDNSLYTSDDQFLYNLRMTDDNVALSDEVTYNYEKTGEFTASLTASVPTEESVGTAVAQMFAPTNSGTLEVQSMLLVTDASEDSPDLTEEELDRLIELMNVDGAGVSRHPDGSLQMVVTPLVKYVLNSISTQEDRLFGLLGGTYALEASSEVIIFEITTLLDIEGNVFLFYLPIVGPENLEAQVLEQGTYTLQLNSAINF